MKERSPEKINYKKIIENYFLKLLNVRKKIDCFLLESKCKSWVKFNIKPWQHMRY